MAETDESRRRRPGSADPLASVSTCGHFGCLLAGIAVVALGLRLLHAWLITRSLGTAQIHDAAYYHDVAWSLLGKQSSPTLTGDVAFANVGYPYFLSWIYGLGLTINAVLIVQATVGAATTVLTGLAARDCFASAKVGLYAAVICAIYAPSIFYDGLLLTPSLSAFLSALLLWGALRIAVHCSWSWALVVGAAIAGATLLRASQLPLLVGMSVAVCVALTRAANQVTSWARARAALALWLAAGVCMAPFVITQSAHSHSWAPLTVNGGSNFWIGNHQGAAGTYTDAPFLGASHGGDFQHTVVMEREKFLAEARRRADDPALTLPEADVFWWKESVREVTASPTSWLTLLARKLAITFNGYEPRTNASFALLEEISPLLRFNPLRFGLLIVLAVFGAAYARGRWQSGKAIVVAPVVIVPMFTCVTFFVSGEYRHPAFPALAVLAGLGIDQLVLATSRRASLRAPRSWARDGICLTAIVCAYLPMDELGPARDRKAYAEALATTSADGAPPTQERYATALQLLSRHTESLEDTVLSAEAGLLVLANRAIQFRDRDAAAQLIETARGLWRRQLAPEETTHLGLDAPTVTRIRRNLVRRVSHLARRPFVRQWPDVDRALALLGGHSWLEAEASMAAGNVERAEAFVTDALAWAPHSVTLLAYRAQLEAQRGRDPTRWFERSLAGYPKLPLPALLLSEHLAAERQPQKAIAILQAATLERDYDERLRYALGSLMNAHASGWQMRDFFSAAVRSDPKPQTSLYFLALAHNRLGADEAAIDVLARALEIDPAHEMSQRLWGLILEQQGKLVPALEHLVEATRIHPEFRAALEDVARLAERLGHPGDAARWRQRARLCNPETPHRFVYWAKYLHAKGRHVAAVSELRRRLRDAPNDPEALALLGTILGGGKPGTPSQPATLH